MKKNLRKIPFEITAKLRKMEAKAAVVGCAKKFKASAIKNGDLEHLGIRLTKAGIQMPEFIIPPADQGRFSDRNINGELISRKDLPMETHYNSVETPNWGDDYKGTHTVNLPYKKYPREFRPPRELEIAMRCQNKEPNQKEYIIVFQVVDVLETNRRNFKERLFTNLNLLQENIGSCGVEPANVAIDEYAKSLHVSWEILPPGSREETIERVFRGKVATDEEKDVAGERYDFFMSLKPQKFVFGSSGFRRYFGALLEENLVVFENIQYGNAVYILFDNWESLSKRSRIDLLSGKYGSDFERVIHKSGWKSDIRSIVKEKRAQ